MSFVARYQQSPWVGVRLTYFCIFAANGAFGPFLWPYLRGQALSGTQLGLISATGPLLSLLTQPVIGWVADRLGDCWRVLAVLAAGAVATNFVLGHVTGFLPILVSYALWTIFHGPLIPVVETLNLAHCASTGDSYGRARMWGAIGFSVSALAASAAMSRLPLHAAFGFYPVWVGLLFLGAAFGGGGVVRISERPQVSLRALLTAPGLRILMLVAFLINAAFAAHNTFFSIHVQSLGAGPDLVGATWAVAGLSEIPVLFWFDRIAKRWGIRTLLVLGGLCYAARYLLYVTVSAPQFILAVQLLQGTTFPLVASALVLMTSRTVPPHYRATGQTLMAAVGGSLAGIVGNLSGGWLFDHAGSLYLYAALAGTALAGSVAALWLRTEVRSAVV